MTQSPLVWEPDAWSVIEFEEEELATLLTINRKVTHLLYGLASLIERSNAMQAELQPIADAITALEHEEGDVAVAVKALQDKVAAGGVVRAEDVQTLVDAISGVTTGLKAVVDPTPEPQPTEADGTPIPTPDAAAPVEVPAPVETVPASDTPVPDVSIMVTPASEAPVAPPIEAPLPEPVDPTSVATETSPEPSAPEVPVSDPAPADASSAGVLSS